MADNVEVNAIPVATDEISTVHYQKVKLVDGTADSATVIASGEGAKAGGLRVAFPNDQVVPVTSTPSALANLAPTSTEADQRLTVDATAGGVQFTSFHGDTTHILWSLEDAQIRVTFDGSASSSANGHILEVGDMGVWQKATAVAAKFSRTDSTSGVIHASQFKL